MTAVPSRSPATGSARTGHSLTDREFRIVRETVDRLTGIHLPDIKRELVNGRLARRLRRLQLDSFKDYLEYLQSHADEAMELVNVITTNVTSFYRHPDQFEMLRTQVFPALDHGRPLQVWSSACSTGEEPWSILGTALRAGLRLDQIRITATDIDTSVLAKAQAGIYPATAAEGVDPAYGRLILQRGRGRNAGKLRVLPSVRSAVSFWQLNLFDDWPHRQPFDVIFCRNVAIYFTAERKRALYNRLLDVLRPGGILFLGSSETLTTSEYPVQQLRNHAYLRTQNGAAA